VPQLSWENIIPSVEKPNHSRQKPLFFYSGYGTVKGTWQSGSYEICEGDTLKSFMDKIWDVYIGMLSW
jgi:hypothetical protein